MIDISRETVLTFAEAAKRLPCRRNGKRTHPATLYRWASIGLRGAQLETIRIGSSLCTSAESLQRFFERLSKPSSAAADQREKLIAPTEEEVNRQLDAYSI